VRPETLSNIGGGEPFYMPSPEMFRHSNAYRMFTNYAAELEEAGLVELFPRDPELRNVVIELLAERYAVEMVEANPDLVDEAVAEARDVIRRREEA
jgi:hypothetical protein